MYVCMCVRIRVCAYVYWHWGMHGSQLQKHVSMFMRMHGCILYTFARRLNFFMKETCKHVSVHAYGLQLKDLVACEYVDVRVCMYACACVTACRL